ncbi:MAG TPA: proton-conducting transporter membrane subunit [Candidatus Omnitrophota bacterium]|nr:proton-conducting transporter membrane subunit [Candidatus Omnitrophota bacterium]
MINFLGTGSLYLLDPLALFFAAVIALIAVPSAIFSIGYLNGHYPKEKIIGSQLTAAVFVLSMLFVVSTGNAFYFLVAWEIMSLSSFFLVLFDRESEKSVQAGIIYLVMTHIGTAFLTAALVLMFRHAHSFDYRSIQYSVATMTPQLKNLLFIFLLIGFGTKAGAVPLHIWLPYAHPQAPSHISSLMSGVMIKTAIYGMVRYMIFILGGGPAWWGILMLSIAAISSLLGVIYALMEHDLKRLLAYHSVENIGIILFGVGASLLFFSTGFTTGAVFALMAGLYHLINHAVFKGLLFLCAGSVDRAAGTRDIEKLGGLVRTMPLTAFFFLTGALAISALPPLNGFISEWLTFQAFFIGALHATVGIRVVLGICAAVLALTGGLAAACFVKAFGITFLAMPRSRHASDAVESPLSMQIGMGLLAALCLILGLFAPSVAGILSNIAGYALGAKTAAPPASFTLNIPLVPQNGISPMMIALALCGFALAAFTAYSIRRPAVRKAETWHCGYYELAPRNEYSATAFSKPFRIAFSFILMPYRRTKKIADSAYHIKNISYETHTTPFFKTFFYEPLLKLIFRSARSMKTVQAGSINLYLGYIFFAVIALILLIGRF